MLLLISAGGGGGYKIVSTSDGILIVNPSIAGSAEAYWSTKDPDLLYYHNSNQLKSFRISNTTHSTVATFDGTGGLPSASSITFGGGDVDLSEDGDHIPIFCDGERYCVYQFSTGKVGGIKNFSLTSENVLWAEVTPDNNVLARLNTTRNLTGTVAISNGSSIIVGTGTSFLSQVTQGAYITASGQRRYVISIEDDLHCTVNSNFTTTASGLTASYLARMIMYDKNFNFIRAIAPFGGHASTGRDVDGSEILLIDGANSPDTPPSGCANNGIFKYKLSDGSVTCLFGFPDFNLTGHLSFSNHRGHHYCLISYYDGRIDPALGTALLSTIIRADWASAGVWKKYYNEAILIKVDGTEVRRLCHLRTRITGFGVPGGSPAPESHYWFSARANLSKVITANRYPASFIFASNMNLLRHRTVTGTISNSASSRNFTGSGTTFLGISGETTIGGELTVGGETRIIDQTSTNTDGRVSVAFTSAHSNAAATAWGHDTNIESFVGEIGPALQDFTDPVISNISSGTPNQTDATITWDTDEPATTQIEWGSTNFYGQITTFDPTLANHHSVTLTGLSQGTLYHYRIKSRDLAGNYALSADQTFSTSSTPGELVLSDTLNNWADGFVKAFGSDFATDTFTEASDLTLASHTPEVGGTIVSHPDASYTSTATIDAATDRIFPNGTAAYYYSASPPSADYYVQADFFAAAITSVNAAICGRMDTTANTMYIIRLNNGTSWELRKIVAGTATTIGSSTNQLPTNGTSKTVKLIMSGTSISVLVNGVTEISVTDSAISAAGKAGVRFAGAASSTTGFHLDNFSAR